MIIGIIGLWPAVAISAGDSLDEEREFFVALRCVVLLYLEYFASPLICSESVRLCVCVSSESPFSEPAVAAKQIHSLASQPSNTPFRRTTHTSSRRRK